MKYICIFTELPQGSCCFINEPEPVLLSEYDIIKNLNFSRSREYGEPVRDTLTVTLCSDLLSDDEQNIEFYGVKRLIIGSLGIIGGGILICL